MPLEIPAAAALRGGETGFDAFAGEGAGGRIGFGLFAFGLFARPFDAMSFLWSRASRLFAKKLAVFAKVFKSSTACSRLAVPDPFSITSIKRRSSSRSSITVAQPWPKKSQHVWHSLTVDQLVHYVF
jgi:hypothetical protein